MNVIGIVNGRSTKGIRCTFNELKAPYWLSVLVAVKSHSECFDAAPSVSSSRPALENAAARTEPFIFRLATHCRLLSETRGT